MAHNVASIKALVEAMKHDLPQWNRAAKRTLILATSREKDAGGMLKPLVESFDEIILTKYQDNPRGKSEKELLKIARSIQKQLSAANKHAANLSTQPNPDSAWSHVSTGMTKEDFVCISGSAFLVAELRKTILDSAKSPASL